MRGTITFDHHGQHAWLHFAIRLAFVLLLILLILFAAEKVVGQTQKAALTHAKARLGKSNFELQDSPSAAEAQRLTALKTTKLSSRSQWLEKQSGLRIPVKHREAQRQERSLK